MRKALNLAKLYSTLEKRTVSLIPGDGIGPEISNCVKMVFEAAKVRF